MRRVGAVELTTVNGERCALSVWDITSWGENGDQVDVYVRGETDHWEVRESYDEVTRLITLAAQEAFGAARN